MTVKAVLILAILFQFTSVSCLQSGVDEDLLFAGLEVDDECSALGESGACALEAFQLRASKIMKTHTDEVTPDINAHRPRASAGKRSVANDKDGIADLSVDLAIGVATKKQVTGDNAKDQNGASLEPSNPNPGTRAKDPPAPIPQKVPPKFSTTHSPFNLFLHVFGVLLGFITTLLTVVALYDLSLWRSHRARVKSCKGDVRRVQHVLLQGESDDPLCPYCLETVRNTWIKSKVVFICGHCFHMDCANLCFENDDDDVQPATCPLCRCSGSCASYTPAQKKTSAELAASLQVALHVAKRRACKTVAIEGSVSDTGGLATDRDVGDCADLGGTSETDTRSEVSDISDNFSICDGVPSPEDVRTFLLASLHRKYPEFVSKTCIKRWNACHIEKWLTGLKTPVYDSTFRKRWRTLLSVRGSAKVSA